MTQSERSGMKPEGARKSLDVAVNSLLRRFDENRVTLQEAIDECGELLDQFGLSVESLPPHVASLFPPVVKIPGVK